MKNNIFVLVASILSTMFIGGCTDDDVINEADLVGQGIQFGVGAKETNSRTIYDEGNPLQINWKAGDAVSVFCEQAQTVKSANYTVTPSEPEKFNGSLAAEGSQALQWGTGEHTFYAVYPKDDRLKVNEKGVITFPINRNQIVDYTGKKVGNMYITEPRMENAYMVAMKTTSPVDGPIGLQFKPVMTTLDIIVQGPTGKVTSTDNLEGVHVTGLSVVSTYDQPADATSFDYQIDGSKKGGQNLGSRIPGGASSTNTTFIGFEVDGIDKEMVLKEGESLKVTAFLPPVPTKFMKSLKVRVQTTGARELIATIVNNEPALDDTQIDDHSKRKITLPKMPTVFGSNNWMSHLDDDIYLCQLSIPGAHDAVTAGITNNLDAGKTQVLTVKQQLEMGIRVFDIRPTLDRQLVGLHYEFSLGNIYHGFIDTSVTLDAVFKEFDDFLTLHPREGIIVIMRNETGDRYNGGKNGYPEQYSKILADYLDPVDKPNTTIYQRRAVLFHQDMTLNDLRGGIMLLSRDRLMHNGKQVGNFIQWGHKVPCNENLVMDNGTKQFTCLTVQDVYAPKEVGGIMAPTQFPALKPSYVMTNMDKSSTYHTENVNKWMINHCSGYNGVNNYAKNAHDTNPLVYQYLTGKQVTFRLPGTGGTLEPPLQEFTFGPKVVGTTGIVLLDFVGIRNSSYLFGNYNVYGDLLPQTIIDNNYKYQMKRKKPQAN